MNWLVDLSLFAQRTPIQTSDDPQLAITAIVVSIAILLLMAIRVRTGGGG